MIHSFYKVLAQYVGWEKALIIKELTTALASSFATLLFAALFFSWIFIRAKKHSLDKNVITQIQPFQGKPVGHYSIRNVPHVIQAFDVLICVIRTIVLNKVVTVKNIKRSRYVFFGAVLFMFLFISIAISTSTTLFLI
ncbi:hypothetical protein SAMN04487866_1323 [Thermoactinomyces sp. DSM 45891]|uniref:hypothetical protein n=1 Tax=Thermoactinomyces sp. DSM 45891 TaxID=1761907 RepID=UPI000914EAC5|nr:hypothetical protein [Thermoactinomyces sp. DSM 45891]SFX82361.1 hypothetical protein SAMN04487866_1323 [Thermoactinomyces sp. DSM 45891]